MFKSELKVWLNWAAKCSWIRLAMWAIATVPLLLFLLICEIKNQPLPSTFNSRIKPNLILISVLVRAISMMLAWFQAFLAKGLTQEVALHWFQRKPRPLESLPGLVSIADGKFAGLSASGLQLAYSFTFMVFLVSLGPFWTGALTPALSLKSGTREIQIPYYNADDENKHWNRFVGNEKTEAMNLEIGSFSYSPIFNVLGSILDSAASATAFDNVTQTYPKLDNAGYRYLNRSYGVGSSVGFDSQIETQAKDSLVKYSYTEPGYLSTVKCSYNSQMRASVQPRGSYWFQVTQTLPHGSNESILLPGLKGDSEIVALLGNPIGNRAGWGIVTGTNATQYGRLNMTFCEVFFQRRDFHVLVLPGDRLINVTVLEGTLNDTVVLGPEWSNITDNVVRQIGMVVQTSTSAMFSPLGTALMSNIHRTQLAKNNGFISRSLSDTDVALQGMERAIETMVDYILIGLAGAQYFQAGPYFGRKLVSADFSYEAFKIGQLWTIAIVLGINAALLLAFIIVKLLLWRWGQPCQGVDFNFDFSEPHQLILRSSICGNENSSLLSEYPLCKRMNLDDLGPFDIMLDTRNETRHAGLRLRKRQTKRHRV